jgi:hypothetical protein
LGDGRTEANYRNAWLLVRNAALEHASIELQSALGSYAAHNEGAFPAEMSNLAPYVRGGMDPVTLSHYQLIQDSNGGKILLAGRSLCLDDPKDSDTLDVTLTNRSAGGLSSFSQNPSVFPNQPLP